jgi:hypothetical protein
MNPDPKADCGGAPVVVLAGQEWFVPVLAMRQSRIVVPGLMRLMPLLGELQSGQTNAMAKLGEEEFDVIVAVVHAALTRAYPNLTRDEFLDLAISTPELIGALGVVTRQTGFFKPADAGEKNGGEARGEQPAPRNSSTG